MDAVRRRDVHERLRFCERTGHHTAGPLTVSADATVKQTMLAGALGYRIAAGKTNVDVLAGGRYNKIDVDTDIAGALFGLGGTLNRSGDKSWWDPYVGARVTHHVDDRWNLAGYADVGGFGAGSDSTWQILVGATYAYSKTISAKIGYRVLKIDYDKGGFLYDMKNDGLVIGVGFKF